MLRCLGRLQRGVPHGERRAALHRLGLGSIRVGGREPPVARRPRARGRAGEFGERWARLARDLRRRRAGAPLRVGRDSARRDDLRAKLAETGAEAVFLVHSETSTGVVADVEALGSVVAEAGALVVVDAVSSLGAVPLETDAWGLDVVVAGSQKALMTPPGLSLVTVSPRRVGARRALDDCRASTSTGTKLRARRSRPGRRRSRRPSRSSSRSTPRSGSCSRRGSRTRSHAMLRSAAPAARARRQWASSSSRPTRSARRS